MRATTTTLLGAVCEMLSEMLEQQGHSSEEASNPYLTHDDFDKLRALEGRVHELRTKAGCQDFVAAATSLLAEETKRYSGCADDLQALIDRWQSAEQRYLAAVRQAAEKLSLELHLCVRADPRHALKVAFERLIPQLRIGQRPSSTDVPAALEAFRADEGRLGSCVAQLKTAFDSLTASAHDLMSRCGAEIQGVQRRVVERRVVVTAGDHDPEARTDLGTLGAQGKQYAFLAFTKPPKLSHFECDSALGLYLNVAEDVAAGAIPLREAPQIGRNYESFMDAVTSVDRGISEALALQERCRERLAQAEAFHQVVARELSAPRLDQVAAASRGSLSKARSLLARAQQLATIGDIALARHLQSMAMKTADGLLAGDAVEAAIAEQTARLSDLERLFGFLELEASAQSSTWRLTLHELFPLRGWHANLRERLDAFFNGHRDIRWGPGSTLCRRFVEMVRDSRPWCELAQYKPSLRSWALLHDRMTRRKPRSVQPVFAFIAALCAMAHAHDGLSDEECSLITSIARDQAIPLDTTEISRLAAEWRGLPRDERTLDAIAQATLDVLVITDPAMLESLMQGLRRVAQADGDLAVDELAVYHGFVTTITRRMHPTFSD